MKGPTRQPDVDAEPTRPDPPRYWWLKRLTVGSMVLALILSLVRVGWGWEAHRRLARELSRILAAGEPASAPAMNPAPLPDAENGALLYLKAQTLFGTDSPGTSAMEYPDYPPFPPRWHKMEDRSVATNGQMLRLVRQARGFSRFDWGVRVATPASTAFTLAPVSNARQMANLVGDAALHAHLHGDDAEALERVRDLRHAARALDAPPHLLVNHLVSVGIDAVTLYRLQLIAPGLTVADEGEDRATTPPARRPATRAQVRALITELLDEREQVQGLRRSFVGERAASLDVAGWLGSRASLLRPMFDLDAIRVTRANDALVAASSLPNSQAVRQALRAEPLTQAPPQAAVLANKPSRLSVVSWSPPAKAAGKAAVDYTRVFGTVSVGPNTARAIEQDLRVRTERRLTAVALAFRLYRLDHGGQFPPSLEALVPDYLPRVPIDPAAPDGRPLKYVIVRGGLPDGGDRPIVYSVGSDGADRTAEMGPARAGLPNRPQYGYGTGADQWRDLTRWTPPLTDVDAATEAKQEKAAEPILRAIDAAAEAMGGKAGDR